MDRRQFLCMTALALSSPAQSRTRPNILLVVADDLGWGDVSMNGRDSWQTPNIDRLAREGTRFTRFYSGAAVCNPARACLLTGKYGIHNGVKGYNDDLPSSETTIAESLRELGYDTALFGKWHRGQRPDGGHTHPVDQGWDEFPRIRDRPGGMGAFPLVDPSQPGKGGRLRLRIRHLCGCSDRVHREKSATIRSSSTWPSPNPTAGSRRRRARSRSSAASSTKRTWASRTTRDTPR